MSTSSPIRVANIDMATTPNHNQEIGQTSRCSWDPSPVSRPALASSFTSASLPVPLRQHRQDHSSTTWTTSSGDPDLLDDTDELEDRGVFIQEYNRLAKKHGVRLMVPDDYRPSLADCDSHADRKSWFVRTFCRPASSCRSTSSKSSKPTRRKRSISDVATYLGQSKIDGLRNEDLQNLVRLCGESLLYLPPDYAPGSLALPTCFRATAQYLVQHAPQSRGVFRIPGSVRVVNELYEHYCAQSDDRDITGTVRSPNLPLHIRAGVHDVASTFKRLLSGLPGGILGHLALFDALVAIHSQLHGDPEFNRTKRSRVRARLIALAVGSLRSRLRRELICAVFGLLCHIGRSAEVAAREDERGKPLPTSDLMGYSALGIIFGPLLVGDLIDTYSMKLADPSVGLVLFPLTPPRSRNEHRRKSSGSDRRPLTPLSVDKIHVANNIAEMLITHWRDVVRHMKNLGIMRSHSLSDQQPGQGRHRPSPSVSFTPGRDAELYEYTVTPGMLTDRASPRSGGPTPTKISGVTDVSKVFTRPDVTPDALSVKRQRPRSTKSASALKSASPTKQPMKLLSPTVEESVVDLTPVHGSPGRKAAVQLRSQQSEVDVPRTPEKPPDGPTNIFTGHPAQNLPHMAPTICTDQSMIHPALRTKIYRASFDQRRDCRDHADKHIAKMPSTTSLKEGSVKGLTSRFGEVNESISRRDGSTRDLWLLDPQQTTTYFQSRPTTTDSAPGKTEVAGATTQDASLDSSTGEYPNKAQNRRDDRWVEDVRHEGLRQRELTELQARRPNDFGQSASGGEFDTVVQKTEIDTPVGVSRQLRPSINEGRLWTPRCQSSINPDEEGNEDGQTPGSLEDVHSDKTEEKIRTKPLTGRHRASSPSLASSEASGWSYKVLHRLRSKTLSTPRRAWDESASSFNSHGTGRRSAGGVKAMAAMFDNAARESLSANSIPQTVRPHDDANSNTALAQYTRNPSPLGALRPSRSNSEMSVRSPPVHGDEVSGAETVRKHSSNRQALRSSPTYKKDLSSESPNKNPRTPIKLKVLSYAREEPAADPTNLKLQCKHAGSSSQGAVVQSCRSEKTLQQPQEMVSESRSSHFWFQPRETSPMPRQQSSRPPPHPPSLGRMVPNPEQPPIARHIAFSRPSTSSPYQVPPASPALNDRISVRSPGSPNPGGGGNSILHAQIRSLQRQLDVKTEECNQLRSQLNARLDTDVGTLSEQLREAKRECRTWRERAEAAERRVAMFERFTAKLRDDQEAACSEVSSDDGAADMIGGRRVHEGKGTSSGSAHTEDGARFVERLRSQLQGMDGSCSGEEEEEDDEMEEDSTGTVVRDISGSTMSVWRVTEDLIRR